MMHTFSDILDAAKKEGPRKLVVPCPQEKDMPLLAAAAETGLIFPCLIGARKAWNDFNELAALPPDTYRFVEENDPRQALHRALQMILGGDGDILLQGGVSARTLTSALGDKELGLLPKGGVISFVSVFSLLKREKLILVTDTLINNRPTLTEKQQILGNAIRLSGILGIDAPKVAVLAAVEQVNPGIPSTLDAAILSKMSDRRQFGPAVVEGPLDIDCALSQAAAERKGLKSPVTGNVDLYLVPEVDTGHLLAEALVFFGRMQTVGIIMGAVKPVIMDIPIVSAGNRLAEIALACLAAGKGWHHG